MILVICGWEAVQLLNERGEMCGRVLERRDSGNISNQDEDLHYNVRRSSITRDARDTGAKIDVVSA